MKSRIHVIYGAALCLAIALTLMFATGSLSGVLWMLLVVGLLLLIFAK